MFRSRIFPRLSFLIPQKGFFLPNINHRINGFYIQGSLKGTFKFFLLNCQDNLFNPDLLHFFGVITIYLPTIIPFLKANEISNTQYFI